MTAASKDRVLWPVTAWFWALQFAVLNPLLAVLLVSLYGASDAQVGLALSAYNTGGFVASLVIPAAADRRRDYLVPLLLVGISGLVLVAALALAPTLPFAILALLLLGGPPGVGSTLLFAQLRHSGAPPERVVRTRAIVSFAWVAGPLLATAVTAVSGSSGVLALLAAIGLINVCTAVLLLRSRRRWTTGPSTPTPSLAVALRQVGSVRAVWILVSFVLLQATNVAAVTTTGVFVTEALHAPIVWAGVALGFAALLEIPALLLLGRLLERWSRDRLILIGCTAGTLYYAIVASARSPLVLVAAQPLNAAFFAVVVGVGLTVFQDTFGAPGIASGLFTNTRRIAAVLSGALIAVASTWPATYPALYGVSAAAVLLVLLGTLVQRRAHRTPASE